MDREALSQLPALDRAAVAVAKGQLESLDALTDEVVHQMQELVSNRSAVQTRPDRIAESKQPVTSAGYDLDDLRGASLVAATVAADFFIWVLMNPPGHVGWIVLPGVVAMMVAGTQQLSATVFIRPTAIALAFGVAVYVFLLPKLSTFAELGLVLFAAMFIVNYFFKGIGQFAGMIGVLPGISVQHEQAYSFAAAANNYVYVLGSFMLVYGMSYIIQSPRPEKAVLWLLGLRAMAYRIDELLDSRAVVSTPSLAPALADGIRSWRVRLESTLADWARGLAGRDRRRELRPGERSVPRWRVDAARVRELEQAIRN